MTKNLARDYSCKDEELTVICKFAAFSLKRDVAAFAAFSPKFNEAYVTRFETNIASATEMVNPNSETLQLKTITKRLYATLDGLIDPINRMTGYLKLAHANIHVTAADFGLVKLRKDITSKDAEGAINNLRTVITNSATYKAMLAVQGFTDEQNAMLVSAATLIADDNQKQYEILSNRKTIVQSNLALFNSLFEQLNEILTVGKILYKATDAVKLQEYTFNDLKKKVRIITNPASDAPIATPIAGTAAVTT